MYATLKTIKCVHVATTAQKHIADIAAHIPIQINMRINKFPWNSKVLPFENAQIYSTKDVGW